MSRAARRSRKTGTAPGFQRYRPSLDPGESGRLVAHGGGPPTNRRFPSTEWLQFRYTSVFSYPHELQATLARLRELRRVGLTREAGRTRFVGSQVSAEGSNSELIDEMVKSGSEIVDTVSDEVTPVRVGLTDVRDREHAFASLRVVLDRDGVVVETTGEGDLVGSV